MTEPIFSERLAPDDQAPVWATVAMSAEARRKSRQRLETGAGTALIALARGSVLRDGDRLASADGQRSIRIAAAEEPILRVTAGQAQDLLRAAYHLGNRHVPVEIRGNTLLLSPDRVLQAMLVGLGLTVEEAIASFEPESGAYGHAH